MLVANKFNGDPASPVSPGRLLLIALSLWALAMIVPGLQRVFDSVGSFGLSVDNDGIVTDVVTPFQSPADSPAAAAGIAAGDRIDLGVMRCIPLNSEQCSSLVAVLGGLGGMQSVMPHREITLTLRSASGGTLKTVALQSALSPLSLAERFVLLADTVAGVAVIIIAFWLVWTRPSWMTWGLFLYVIWINPGQSYTYYALLQRWPVAVLTQELAEALAQGAAFAGLAIFALRFPEDRTEPRWQMAERAVPLLAAAMIVLALLSFSNMAGFRSEKITEINFLAGYAVDAAVLLILLERRRALPPQDDQRMRWVIWGCVIGLPTFICAELCQSSDLFRHWWGFAPSQVFIGLLYLPNGVLAYFASEAVWQRRVVSVAIPLRRGTILAALSFAAGVPIFLLHEQLARVQERYRLPVWIWLLVVAPLILLVLGRLHEIAVKLVDRVFNRRFHAARRKLENASEAIAHAESLVEIDRLLVESAVRTLCLSSGAVFRNEESVFRRTQDTKGWHGPMRKELRFESDSTALRSLEVGVPVHLDPGGWDSPGLPAGVEAPCLSVPVRSGMAEARAVVLFGPHETGNDIDADERDMLDRFAVRAAAGYERVVSGLLRQEVEQLRAQLLALQGGDRQEPAGS